MCFSSGGGSVTNPAPYALDNSQSAVTQTTTPAKTDTSSGTPTETTTPPTDKTVSGSLSGGTGANLTM